ncbi:hypothetical protein ATO6_04280 [Oceanicola sp. 22II-s10i]|uniref:hypothetical protein n=1 Tax=Oceanicola sp. 22II-s10i TaxID=1317116 RepID=UPI000B51F18E|nr:hypothetical protein [Oceanicola sp. 22II-s10i]OWU86085.1 hypothetical protein ATO6_04280 [Oceanicola sp. 22II-s10i]
MNSAKESEFLHLNEFFRAAGIVPEKLEPYECPDFIAVIDGETVGIELTIARHEAGKFGALQIEHAQSEYAKALRKLVEKNAREGDDGLIINIAFVDGVPVSVEDKDDLPRVAALISDAAAKLPNPGAITIWSERWARIRYDGGMRSARSEPSAQLPEFIQNISLYRDGRHDIKVTGSRGGITPDFDDRVLLPILKSKNDRLKKYAACDRSWLVIVSRVMQFEGHSPQTERANAAFSSFATTFGIVNVTRPIPSDFDETYLFKWPSEVTRLSGD